jgi:hypothetical protein
VLNESFQRGLGYEIVVTVFEVDVIGFEQVFFSDLFPKQIISRYESVLRNWTDSNSRARESQPNETPSPVRVAFRRKLRLFIKKYILL